jgi:hypothetical protein
MKFNGVWKIESPEGVEKFSQKLSEIDTSSTETYVDKYNIRVIISSSVMLIGTPQRSSISLAEWEVLGFGYGNPNLYFTPLRSTTLLDIPSILSSPSTQLSLEFV